MITHLLTIALQPGQQVSALPGVWLDGNKPARCAPGTLHLALLDTDAPGVPILLRLDKSAVAPSRRLEPAVDTSGRTVVADLPRTHPHLELDARHTPAEVAALTGISAPTLATDGYDVHDLDTVSLHLPGDASGTYRLWAWDGSAWTPWQGEAAAAIGAAGLTRILETHRLIRRVAVEIAGLAGPLTPRWSFSLAADATVTLTLQLTGWAP